MTSKIFVVEDDVDLREYLKEILQGEGYVVQSTQNGREAIRSVEVSPPDLMILDLGLPDIRGEVVCEAVKEMYADLPIIFLTAKSSSPEATKGLSLGADDYITKPFKSDELLARVRAKLRHRQKIPHKIVFDDVFVNSSTYEVFRGEKKIRLTRTEFELFYFLLVNKERVVTREMILDWVWKDDQNVEARIVDVYIGYLRKKVDSWTKNKLIHSVRGFGYLVRSYKE